MLSKECQGQPAKTRAVYQRVYRDKKIMNPKFRLPSFGSKTSITRRTRRRSIVPVAMMDVRIVRVSVGQFLVVMDVGMWLAGWIGWLVDVVVMLVVRVEMVVRHCLVPVRMGVALGEM